MSSRFLKKVEKAFGNKSEAIENNFKSESSEEEFESKTFNKFDILHDESESDRDSDNIEKSIGLDEKFSKKIEIIKKSRQKKQKSKKQNEISKTREMTEDEIIDQFVNPVVISVDQEENISSCDILAVKIRNLNENLELQQMFGVSVTGTTQNASNDRSRRNNLLSVLKCTFGKRGPDWPQVSINKLGLTMERYESSSSNFNWCVVTCSDYYIRGERALKTVMRTGDYQDHLREWPYHVNTLLQMATLLINQEDFTMAADILKRVFYVYETISPMGLSLLGYSSGVSQLRTYCCLDYRYRLNRGIFIALFQWIHYLCQRSCFVTALEYCKVILNINVVNDPLAMILIIDDIAIRCNQFDFLIQFCSQFNSSKSLMYLPNFVFSLSLSHFLKASSNKCRNPDFSQADDLLQTALCRFPSFLTTFIDHCSIKVDQRITQSSFFNNSRDSVPLSLLIKLYAKRSLNLWKNESVLKWVEANVQRLLDRFESHEAQIVAERQQIIDIYKRTIPLAIKRHVILSGHGELIDQGQGAGTFLLFDPFPPANSEGGFDHYSESDASDQLEESWIINLFRSFLPSFR